MLGLLKMPYCWQAKSRMNEVGACERTVSMIVLLIDIDGVANNAFHEIRGFGRDLQATWRSNMRYPWLDPTFSIFKSISENHQRQTTVIS